MKMKGLGRGLDALLAGDESKKEIQRSLPVTALQPGKYQPRTQMDKESLEELAASIRAQGLMQPILVRPVSMDRYEIIAGERRWRASQLAGLTEVPTLIREIPDEAALAMALIENIQRENLNPLEEALGLQRLVDEFSMTHQQAADAVGRSSGGVQPAAPAATGEAGAGHVDGRHDRHGSRPCIATPVQRAAGADRSAHCTERLVGARGGASGAARNGTACGEGGAQTRS